MADDITPIRLAALPVDESIVELFERLLADAKEGKIVGLAGVTQDVAGEFSEFYSRSALVERPVIYLSYLRVLQMRFERQIPLDPPVPR